MVESRPVFVVYSKIEGKSSIDVLGFSRKEDRAKKYAKSQAESYACEFRKTHANFDVAVKEKENVYEITIISKGTFYNGYETLEATFRVDEVSRIG